MSWEYRVELNNARTVGFLDASKGGVVDVARISAVSVAPCDNTAVYASRIAVPQVEIDVLDGFAI